MDLGRKEETVFIRASRPPRDECSALVGNRLPAAKMRRTWSPRTVSCLGASWQVWELGLGLTGLLPARMTF